SNSRYLTSNKPRNKLPRLEVPGARMRRSPTAPTSPGATALKLWIVLARAFDAVDRHSRASIARFGLGTTEFGVLEVLYHKRARRGRPPPARAWQGRHATVAGQDTASRKRSTLQPLSES